MLRFDQVDVFTDEFCRGNPVAVVHDAGALSTEQMAAFANWTNLSETTFLLPPSDPAADYRLRIFTAMRELPFAGHPTLGSARAWLAAGGAPQRDGEVVQECDAGLVRIRREEDRLALLAPPLLRGGEVADDDRVAIARALRLSHDDVLAAQWCQNGPEWVALQLRDAEAVLAVEPDYDAFGSYPDIGIVGLHEPGGDVDVEVRAFVGKERFEDPVTGSLNAALGQWLIPAGITPPSYVAAQGTVLGRRGRVFVGQDGAQGDDGAGAGTDSPGHPPGGIWVGGHTIVGISGTVAL